MTELEYYRAVARQEVRTDGAVSVSTLTRIEAAGGFPEAEERNALENA